MRPRPLNARLTGGTVQDIPFTTSDGTRLSLCRISPRDDGDRPVVLLLHGLTASADMFVLPEIRNLVEVLLDAGYEPWLLDWRGSCRLPYNEGRERYTLDDVALYDIPEAVALVRERIDGRPLSVVAHCIGAMSLSMSMAADLVPGLTAVVAQGSS
ncbi:alpha/beta fold hydrolase [Micromonospora sp. M12]